MRHLYDHYCCKNTEFFFCFHTLCLSLCLSFSTILSIISFVLLTHSFVRSLNSWKWSKFYPLLANLLCIFHIATCFSIKMVQFFKLKFFEFKRIFDFIQCAYLCSWDWISWIFHGNLNAYFVIFDLISSGCFNVCIFIYQNDASHLSIFAAKQNLIQFLWGIYFFPFFFFIRHSTKRKKKQFLKFKGII